VSTQTHTQPSGLTRSEILLPEEVAQILRSSRKKVLSEARKGRLPVLKFGRERRFLRDDVDEYIRQLRNDTQRDMRPPANQPRPVVEPQLE
jgi:excisionase family DNA binding protein